MSNNDIVVDERALPLLWMDRDMLKTHGAALGVYGIAVYMALVFFVNADGECYPSQKTIANMIGCGERSVRDALGRLKNLGLISISTRADPATGAQTSNRYGLLSFTPRHQMPPPPAPHADEVLPQQVAFGGGHDNNPAATEQASDQNDSEKTLPAITLVWEQEAKQMLSPLLAENLHDLEDTYGYQEVVDAIREAVEAKGVGKFSVRYVQRILERWAAEGRDDKRPPRDEKGERWVWF